MEMSSAFTGGTLVHSVHSVRELMVAPRQPGRALATMSQNMRIINDQTTPMANVFQEKPGRALATMQQNMRHINANAGSMADVFRAQGVGRSVDQTG